MSKSKISKYKAHSIRSRGQTWQVDFGTKDGKRIQRSYKTKQNAQSAIDGHLEESRIEQLNWEDIDLGTKRIRVPPEVAKKRRMRYVDISNNLADWLAPHRKDRGVMYFGRYDFDKARRKANVTWSSDVLRHSFGSYHIAQHEDAAKTALQMGHTRTDILFNHYRDLVTREDAASFWGITPRVEDNVIQLASCPGL